MPPKCKKILETLEKLEKMSFYRPLLRQVEKYFIFSQILDILEKLENAKASVLLMPTSMAGYELIYQAPFPWNF